MLDWTRLVSNTVNGNNRGQSAQSHSWKRKYQLRNTESSLTPTKQSGEGGGLTRLTRWVFFVCGFSSHSTIFHAYRDDTITCERLQNLTYARSLMATEQ